MIPIHELLHRIRWDEEFAKGDFVIGYFDRLDRKIVKVPLSRIHLVPGDHFSFQATDPDGYTHDVPFHRVREVYKDGRMIWQREH